MPVNDAAMKEVVGKMAKNVLIVEDNQLNAKLFNDLAEAAGYETILCGDGGLVEQVVREKRPDLILMDVQMPNISGFDVTKALKKDPATQMIPIVIVTAHAMKGDEEHFLENGADAYLAKPVGVADFLAMLDQFLGG